MNPGPKPVAITVAYSDGTTKTFDKGLLARIAPSEGVELTMVGLHSPDFLTILVALEEASGQILADGR